MQSLFAHRGRAEADERNNDGADEGDEQNFINLEIGLIDNNIGCGKPDNDQRERGPRIFHKFNLTQKFANFFIFLGVIHHQIREPLFGH